MKELDLPADQIALITAPVAVEGPCALDDAGLLDMPLPAAKQLAMAAFERRYLVRVMEQAAGSVSEGARRAGLDRTNFRRLLQRHNLR